MVPWFRKMTGHIVTPTPALDQSLDFYSRCGFAVVSRSTPTIVSDGQTAIEIDPARTARAGVKLFSEDWSDALEKLKKVTLTHKIESGHVLGDGNGVWIYIMQGQGPQLPPFTEPHSILGKGMGVSIETTDMARSIAIWEALGYAITMGTAESGWAVVSADGCPGISIMKPLMCPHLFFNPSLTYFNGKEGNPKVIAAVRKAGIPITEEITHFNKEGIVDNIIIRDPGGLGFFLFND